MIRILPYDSNEQLTPHINAREIRCKCGKQHETHIDVDMLEKIENIINDIADFEGVKPSDVKIYISSGYRCRQHDINVGGNGSGAHTTGNAIDFEIIVNHKIYDNKIIAGLLQDYDFNGIGRIDENYIHGDTAPISMHGGKKWLGDETIPNGTSNSIINEPMTYWNFYGISKPCKKSESITIEMTVNGKKYKGVLTNEN